MTAYASPKLRGYAAVAAAALFAALALGRPELAAVAAPFLLFVAVGLARARRPSLRVGVEVGPRSTVEGALIELTIELEAADAVEELRVTPIVPAGLVPEGHVVVELPAGQRRRARVALRCERWGAYLPGDLLLSATDRYGLVTFRGRHEDRIPVKVYPRSDELRATPRPSGTLPFVGGHDSRRRGDGIEFAETRPFVPGDRVRSINWRVTARREGVWVTERHPEQSIEAVVFLDTFPAVEGARGSSLDVAVRIAAAVATAYLEQRDRVAFVSFGGTLRWLLPEAGLRQLYRILDALLDTEISLSYAWKNVDVIPARALPPGAVVVAITPLLDQRSVAALFDLRVRGFELAVVEIPPQLFVGPGASDAARLARRVWMLKRELLRRRFEEIGVPVVAWREDAPLEQLGREVEAYRRNALRGAE